jgi:hypothetical protein
MGAGQPYPSTCVVSGLEGAITDVNVELTGLSHGPREPAPAAREASRST